MQPGQRRGKNRSIGPPPQALGSTGPHGYGGRLDQTPVSVVVHRKPRCLLLLGGTRALCRDRIHTHPASDGTGAWATKRGPRGSPSSSPAACSVPSRSCDLSPKQQLAVGGPIPSIPRAPSHGKGSGADSRRAGAARAKQRTPGRFVPETARSHKARRAKGHRHTERSSGVPVDREPSRSWPATWVQYEQQSWGEESISTPPNAPERLASEDVIVNAPMSFAGSAQRIIRIRRHADGGGKACRADSSGDPVDPGGMDAGDRLVSPRRLFLFRTGCSVGGRGNDKAEALSSRGDLMGTIQGSAAGSAATIVAATATAQRRR